MEMNYLSDVFALLSSHLISRNLIFKPAFHRVYQLDHMGGCLFTRALSASSFHPVMSCLCGRRRWRPHVPLPDKISPKLVKFRGSCSQRSPRYTLYCCVCAFVTSNSRLLCFFVSPGPGQAYGKNLKKSDLRSDFKRICFPSVTPAHTSEPLPLIRCQTRLQSRPGKSENKNLKSIPVRFLLSFSVYALTSHLLPSSISFERILKCQIKLQPSVH